MLYGSFIGSFKIQSYKLMLACMGRWIVTISFIVTKYSKDVTKMQNGTINGMIHRMDKFYGIASFYTIALLYHYSLVFPV